MAVSPAMSTKIVGNQARGIGRPSSADREWAVHYRERRNAAMAAGIGEARSNGGVNNPPVLVRPDP
jgi:hypothetical protein